MRKIKQFYLNKFILQLLNKLYDPALPNDLAQSFTDFVVKLMNLRFYFVKFEQSQQKTIGVSSLSFIGLR